MLEWVSERCLNMNELGYNIIMTRGNQRDIDRERARKRAEANGPTEKKGDFGKRRETDAEIMRKKQEEAMKRKTEGQAQGSGALEESKVPRKK